ncbi:MAG: Lrp/AsnC ligand binding domain-containing protein [Candidatus Bathyarchaeota archaeon]|nr:Lrp/AsnC ligand binding domain-containing protein [Candidatus Bathyarchaeota archaeon]
MKVSVYVFVQVEKGEPWQIAADLSKIEGVKTAHIVTGQYDIVVFAELDSLETLKDVVKRVQRIEGVQRTQTAVCIP